MSAPTTTAPDLAEHSSAAEIKKLPSYFPTFYPECKDQANAFFACFEKHAVMKDDKDTVTPKMALGHCQETLKGYMQCQEVEEAKRHRADNKAWWQFW